MKHFKKFVVVGSLLLSQVSFAAFSVDELHVASQTALKDFSMSYPDHLAHLVGYKTWKSDDDAYVKVYVDHGGMSMEFEYLCHKHPSSIQCHEQ